MSSASVATAKVQAQSHHNAALEGGRTVLIAVDASEHSRTAFEWYMENVYNKGDFVVISHIPETPDLPNLSFKRFFSNVYRSNDMIVINHVEEPPHFPSFSFKDGLHLPVEEWRKVIEEQIVKVNKLQSDYEADLVSKKVHYKITGEHARNIGEAIICEAEKEKAQLIVVGTRGLSPLRRTLLGSVSDYVVRHSTVPVLVCPSGKGH